MPNVIDCPECGEPSKVTNSVKTATTMRRHRRCTACQSRFSTYETLDPDSVQQARRAVSAAATKNGDPPHRIYTHAEQMDFVRQEFPKQTGGKPATPEIIQQVEAEMAKGKRWQDAMLVPIAEARTASARVEGVGKPWPVDDEEERHFNPSP